MSVIGAMSVKIGADVSKLVAGTAVASSSLTSLSGIVSALNSKLGRTAIIGGVLLVTFANFAKGSVDEFIKFEDALVRSTSVFGKVSEEMSEALKINALDALKGSIQAPEEIAEAYRYLGAAGFTAIQSMDALTTVVDFATAGMFDLARATDLITDAQSAMGLRVNDSAQNIANMTYMADRFVRAYTTANASIEQFSEAISNKAGAALRFLNKDLEEGLAILSVFADSGTKGREAGTQLSMVFDFMTKAALKNKGALKKWNVEVFDTTGNFRHMADIIGDMETAFVGLSTEQQSAAMLEMGFQARTQKTLKILIGKSDLMRRFEKRIRSVGMTSKQMADIMRASVVNQLKITKNNIKALRIELGEKFAPAILLVNKSILATTIALSKVPSIVWSVLAGVTVFTTTMIALIASFFLLKVMLFTVIPMIFTMINGYVIMASPILTIIGIVALLASIFIMAMGSGTSFIERMSTGFNNLVFVIKDFFLTLAVLWDMTFGGFNDLMKVWFVGFQGEFEKGLLVIITFFQQSKEWAIWFGNVFKELGFYIYNTLVSAFTATTQKTEKIIQNWAHNMGLEFEAAINPNIEREDIADLFKTWDEGLDGIAGFEMGKLEMPEIPDMMKLIGPELDAINERVTAEINDILVNGGANSVQRILDVIDEIINTVRDPGGGKSFDEEKKSGGAFLKGSSEAHSIIAKARNNADDIAISQRKEANTLLGEIASNTADLFSDKPATVEIV
jgi:TP901 family phage tail tape measure protein